MTDHKNQRKLKILIFQKKNKIIIKKKKGNCNDPHDVSSSSKLEIHLNSPKVDPKDRPHKMILNDEKN